MIVKTSIISLFLPSLVIDVKPKRNPKSRATAKGEKQTVANCDLFRSVN